MPVMAPGIDRFKPGHIEVFSDFISYASGATGWVTTATDSGQIVHQDTEGGVALIEPSDGSVVDNDETYMHTPTVFKFGNGRPMYFAARLNVNTAANVNDCNFIAGFSSAAVANSLQDDGAGPPANYYGAVFFKADGSANVFFEVSAGNGDAVKTTTAAVDALVDAENNVYEIVGAPNHGTDYRVWPLINGVPVGTEAQQRDGISMNPTSAAAMRAIIGIKLGASTNHDKIELDWAGARQLRA
jgi:hypothetical protein